MALNPQVPAYLARQAGAPKLADQSVAGMGSALPPHISIQGNSFTLIDITGAALPIGPQMDCIVVDVSNHMCKRYYENDWGPNSDSPPDCWSSNGIGPSRESAKPQAVRCDQCQWNVRGSDTSKMSGKPIKACRDEKWLAVIPSQKIDMAFRFVLPPGSFKNWASFVEKFKNTQLDIVDVIMRVTFQPQVTGVMVFDIVDYIPEQFVGLRNQMKADKGDLLVGRTDVPVTAQIAAQPQTTAAVLPNPGFVQPQGFTQAAQSSGFTQAAQSSVAAAAAQPQEMMVVPAAATSPQDGEPRQRRRRQTAETTPTAAPFPTEPTTGQAGGFGVASGATQPAGFGAAQSNGAGFGMAQGAAPDPALAAMLAGLKPA
jgi:hypothetical protein